MSEDIRSEYEESTFCFVCLSSVEIQPGKLSNRRNNWLLRQLFLEFNSFATRYLELPNRFALKDCENSPGFCESCAVNIKVILELYSELCEVELRFGSKLEELGKLIEENGNDKKHGETFRSRPRLEVVRDFVTTKCLKKGEELQNQNDSHYWIVKDLQKQPLDEEVEEEETEVKEEVESSNENCDEDGMDEVWRQIITGQGPSFPSTSESIRRNEMDKTEESTLVVEKSFAKDDNDNLSEVNFPETVSLKSHSNASEQVNREEMEIERDRDKPVIIAEDIKEEVESSNEKECDEDGMDETCNQMLSGPSTSESIRRNEIDEKEKCISMAEECLANDDNDNLSEVNFSETQSLIRHSNSNTLEQEHAGEIEIERVHDKLVIRQSSRRLTVRKSQVSPTPPAKKIRKGVNRRSLKRLKTQTSRRTETNQSFTSFVCQRCFKGHSTEQSLFKHLLVHEKESIEKGKPCCFCYRTFVSSQADQLHMKIYHASILSQAKPFSCDDKGCNESFDIMAELNSHLATSFTISFTEPPHYCSVCGWGFVNENLFKLHELVHARKRAKGRYQCPTCSCSSFLNVTELQIHYNQKHGSNLAEPALKRARRGLKTKKNDGNQKEIATPPPCSMCGLQFLKWKYLDKHRKEAHNLGVECPTCFNVFGCRSSMTRHIKDQHNPEKGKDTLHPCPYCGIVCKSPSSLQTHIASVHLNEQGYEGKYL
ncbi:unnamed protein product [Orchesella dallaii]|uniref:C2H2-type domain-containing protein n=1 Tax=Orchesella dallaii TaxID=48710 RepID=A0ABP1RHJ5_9HEXA